MIPLWLKIAYTLFVCLLVPVYWRQYGPANFLWFSDIALLVLAPALWLESPLPVSMMALAVVLPELAWNIDYFFRLATGVSLIGLTNYMFDASISRFIRALSLFHVGLPLLLVWLLHRLGCAAVRPVVDADVSSRCLFPDALAARAAFRPGPLLSCGG